MSASPTPPTEGLTVERLDELLDQLVHCVRYSERNPHDGYARDEVMIARRLVKDAARGREEDNNFNEEFFALRDALRDWPKLPSAYVLKWLHFRFPDDWERGVGIQRELGLSIIPPKTECEGGAGMWDRITNGAWHHLPAPPSAPSPGEGEK